MAELGEKGIELEGKDRAAEGTDLLALPLDRGRVELVESSEVEPDLLSGAVIDTPGSDHVPVSSATDGLRGEDHGEGGIIDTLHIPFYPTEETWGLTIIDTGSTQEGPLTKVDHTRDERTTTVCRGGVFKLPNPRLGMSGYCPL